MANTLYERGYNNILTVKYSDLLTPKKIVKKSAAEIAVETIIKAREGANRT